MEYSGMLPHLGVEIAGKTIPVLLDTGSNDSFALPDLDAVPLRFAPFKEDALVAVVGEKWRRIQSSQLAGEARLGPMTWRNPPLAKGQPLIGTRALNKWKAVIDQHARRVYFLGADLIEQWPLVVPPNPASRWGVFAGLEGTSIRLLEVDRGGAFDRAGLIAGDLILTIDGISAFASARESAANPDTDRSRASSSTMRVLREGKEIEMTVVTEPDAATEVEEEKRVEQRS